MQYVLGNQDPLHGPLQIGKTMVPKGRQNDLDWTREVSYNDPAFARMAILPQFPIGSLEDRGRYILRQYMSGNYEIFNVPGAKEALKTLSKKFTGNLYRGIRIGKGGHSPLPKEIIDAIEHVKTTGDI
jgi:hypothetical protein